MHYSIFFILTTEEINILAFYRTTPCSVWSDYRHFGRTPVFFFTVEFEVDIFYKKSVTTQTVRFHNPKHRSLYE